MCVCVCSRENGSSNKADRLGRDHSRAASRDKSINYVSYLKHLIVIKNLKLSFQS